MTGSFHLLEVADVHREIADAVSLQLTLPPGLAEAFRYTPGQHLTLRAIIDGEDVRRSYSLCSAPHENDLRVAIKQVDGGLFSTFANTALKPGAKLEVMPPHGSFTWAFDPARKATYVGFAAGSGITPVLSLLKAALHAEPASTFILLYSNSTTQSVMFLEELAALKDRYMGRLAIHHFLSQEEGDLAILNGRLDSAKVGEVLGTLVDPATIDAAFICGPAPMMEAAEAGLLAAGVPDERILVERFTVGEMSEAQRSAVQRLEAEAAGRTVRLNIAGRRRSLSYDPRNGSILENARAAGLPAPYACKAGVCATCRARVVSGKVEMFQNFGLSKDEVAQGYVLTCQAVPVSDDVELDYDA